MAIEGSDSMDKDIIMDRTLTWIEQGPYETLESARAMDVKLIGVLATASVLAGVMPSLTVTGEVNQFQLDWRLSLFATAGFAYLVNLGVTLWQIWPRTYWTPADLGHVEDYLNSTLDGAREIHLDVIKKAAKKNGCILRSKATWLMVNTCLLGLETLALLFWVVAISMRQTA